MNLRDFFEFFLKRHFCFPPFAGSRHATRPSPTGRGDVAHGQETVRVRGNRAELLHAPTTDRNK